MSDPDSSSAGRAEEAAAPLTLRGVWNMWVPLAASWLLMGAELPLLSAVVARLANPEINLAAYGGIVFPVALLVEAPIIMMLAASTALSHEYESYRKLRRFMTQLSVWLTLLHVIIAFTPVYDWVAHYLIGAPADIIEPGRIGLMIMTPWTWAIAYRRFNQGVLIRFGHSREVTVGTGIRLLSGAIILALGIAIESVAGIVVATVAVTVGVLSEAVFVGVRVRPVVRRELEPLDRSGPELTTGRLLQFYIPLAMTALISLMVQPVLTAAISRLPSAVESLAAWPALNGLIFMVRSAGLAFNEVVIALLSRPNGYAILRQFTTRLAWGLTSVLLIVAATPLATGWFGALMGLSPRLVELARMALFAALLTPAIGVVISWFQGVLVHAHRTRPITESVVLFLGSSALLLAGAVAWGRLPGLFAGLIALTIGGLLQASWQWLRSRDARARLKNG